MAEFRSLDAAMKEIEKKVNKALQTDVADVVKSAMSNAVELEVYDSYTPKKYIRRHALSDTANMQSTMLSPLALAVTNNTPSSPSVITGEVHGGTELSRWVVTGVVPNIFNSMDYPWNYKRDFIQETVNILDSYKDHIDALRKSLISQGLNVK